MAILPMTVESVVKANLYFPLPHIGVNGKFQIKLILLEKCASTVLMPVYCNVLIDIVYSYFGISYRRFAVGSGGAKPELIEIAYSIHTSSNSAKKKCDLQVVFKNFYTLSLRVAASRSKDAKVTYIMPMNWIKISLILKIFHSHQYAGADAGKV